MQPRDFNISPLDLNGSSILVTGGTGSFGKRFVRTVIKRFKPRRLVIFSRDELKQYEMAQELSPQQYPWLRYFIGDVRDRDRLHMALRGIETVVHAAAMKHVPIAEYNPFECIHTNVLGAENLANAAIATGVRRVIALSTDKAASPLNLYGASKLASDKIFIAANAMAGDKGPRFSIVRYGNVVGSRGSVVPFFERLLAEHAEALPITDPRMTRFWITLDQGVDFVLSCLGGMQGGEMFVPKIPSMRISDLARAIAPGLEQRVIGIRPGEKLHETMITEDDARNTLELADRYIIQPLFAYWLKHDRPTGSQPVSEGFSYTSDSNAEWLSAGDLQQWLSKDLR